MQWAALILGIVAAAMLIALSAPFLSPPNGEAATGQTVIAAHNCRPGETKRVMMRGVEDNYAPGNDEPTTLHPRIVGSTTAPEETPTGFDATDPDHSVVGYFEFPAGTASAAFVIKVRPIVDNANDGIDLGDFVSQTANTRQTDQRLYAERIHHLVESGRWKKVNDIYWASAADLPLLSGATVLELARAKSGPRIVDFEISDDTSVDFVAAIACEQSPVKAGLTMRYDETSPSADAIASFDCRSAPICRPFQGNRPCHEERPLLCYIDQNLPAPTPDQPDPRLVVRRWSGGEAAATAPVRGDRFATIADADKFCAAQFGTGWRVAEWHLGGGNGGFSARSGGRQFAGEYWVDIRGAPYGTCWKRNDDAN